MPIQTMNCFQLEFVLLEMPVSLKFIEIFMIGIHFPYIFSINLTNLSFCPLNDPHADLHVRNFSF